MLLNVSHKVSDIVPALTSQIIEVVAEPVIKGFELMWVISYPIYLLSFISF